MRRRWLFGHATALAVVLLGLGLGEPALAQSGDRDYLWKIVTLKCLRHLAKSEPPVPCDAIDISQGWERGLALLKDHDGPGEMLALPTHPVSGIEDPALLTSEEPNYFAMARMARPNVAFHLRHALRPEVVAIAVNAQPNRSQDQLHLRLDCLDPKVVATLVAAGAEIDSHWAPMQTPLQGRLFMARKLSPTDLSRASPFRWLADGVEGARADMAHWSIAMIDAAIVGDAGEILLATKVDAPAALDAESLEDHGCSIATASP